MDGREDKEKVGNAGSECGTEDGKTLKPRQMIGMVNRMRLVKSKKRYFFYMSVAGV